MKPNGPRTRKPRKAPAFVARAERALRRAAHNVKTQNRALGLRSLCGRTAKWWRNLRETHCCEAISS
jgi:hypothetical protein